MSERLAVPEERIQIAIDLGMVNVRSAAKACELVPVPFPVCLASMQKETTTGANIYARYDQSVMAGYPENVERGSWNLMYWLLRNRGIAPTGWGPVQVTYFGPKLSDGTYYGGYWREALETPLVPGLRPWSALGGITKGMQIMRGYYDNGDPWPVCAARYKGGPKNPDFAYAAIWEQYWHEWQEAFR